jgi:uncharacterized Zn finger protein
VAAYVALCEETELLSSDCKALAEIFRSRRKYEKALEWVDRGLKLAKNSRWMESGAYGLDDLRRTLLVTLGRSGEALSSAWAEFESHPNTFSYDELMKYVSRADRPGWHDRAMAASETGSLDSVIELWLHTRETDRLVKRLRSTPVRKLEALSHYTMEPAAKKLAPAYPEVAAKVYQALGLRIVNAGKSKYYGAALSHFGRARHCYEKAGLSSTWSRLVTEVRKKHARKYGFMPGFERISKGMKLREEPTLLERARRRKGQW